MAPVVLQMDLHCYECARKIRKAVESLRGVRRVWASPEQGLVEVHGTADALALRRRIERKFGTPVEIVGDGSASYYNPGTTTHYGASHPPAYGWGAAPPPHAYYSQPPPPPGSYLYPYHAGGYGAGWADPDPYGYAAHMEVSSCSIM
ncbi:unnamed protein product [Alopecurus aequalis]